MASAMANIYFKLVKNGDKKLEQVPDTVRSEVAEMLKAEEEAKEAAKKK